jgi:hypothetical protein
MKRYFNAKLLKGCLEGTECFFLSMFGAIHRLLFGYNQQSFAYTRTGPRGACTLVREQWKCPRSIGLLRLVRVLICLAIFFLPTIYMDLFVPKRPNAVAVNGDKIPGRSKAGVALARELYYAAVFAFLLLALFRGFHTSLFAVGLIIYLLADILIHLFGQVFVWGNLSINPARSLFFALINYFELTIGFAVLYRHWNCISPPPGDALGWLYFSLMTSAGGANVDPTTRAGTILVVIQLSAAFLFVAVIISALLGRTDDPKPSTTSQP